MKTSQTSLLFCFREHRANNKQYYRIRCEIIQLIIILTIIRTNCSTSGCNSDMKRESVGELYHYMLNHEIFVDDNRG